MHKYLPPSPPPNSLPRISFLHRDVRSPQRLLCASIQSLIDSLVGHPLHTSVALFLPPQSLPPFSARPWAQTTSPFCSSFALLISSTAPSSIPLLLTLLDGTLSYNFVSLWISSCSYWYLGDGSTRRKAATAAEKSSAISRLLQQASQRASIARSDQSGTGRHH